MSEQGGVLDELRSRTGVLLAAAAVSSSFLGAEALTRHPRLSSLSIIALISFGIVVMLCLVVMWPKGRWWFTHSVEGLIDAYVKSDKSINYMHKMLARKNGDFCQRNEKKLKFRFFAFQIACLGLGVDVVLWVLDIGTKG